MRKLGFQALSTAWKYSVKDRLTRSLCFHRENASLLFQFSPLFSGKKLAHVTKEYSPKPRLTNKVRISFFTVHSPREKHVIIIWKVTLKESLLRRKPVVSDFVYPCFGSWGAWVNQLSRLQKRKEVPICSVCQFLWYNYAYYGWFQVTSGFNSHFIKFPDI